MPLRSDQDKPLPGSGEKDLGRRPKKPWQRAQTRAAKRMGATEMPASGAFEGLKGDARNERFVIEVKSTTGTSVRVSLDWLLKATREAEEAGKEPMFIVSFEGGVPPGVDKDWIMVPARVVERGKR